MGEHFVVAFIEHPLMMALLIVSFVWLVFSVKRLFARSASDSDAAASARQRNREHLDTMFEEIQEQNQRVCKELGTLTELASQQLQGRAAPGTGRAVIQAFARLDRLIDTFEVDMHRPWARAVVDSFRARVRALMQRHHQGNDPPEALVEALQDLRKEAVSDLQLHRTRDGRLKVFFPADADGTPFRLP